MNRARFGISILLALAACQLFGLDPSTPLSQYAHDVWTSDSGLPQNSITAMIQTRDGYLWLGTQEGLVRFDGSRFTNFDTRNTPAMNDDWVQSLLETRDGTLWIGTVTGLARRKDGEFLPTLGGGLDRAIVGSLLEARDGTVWVGSSLGLTHVAAGELRTFSTAEGLPSVGKIHSLAEDADGVIRVGGSWGTARLENGSFRVWSVRDGFPGGVFAMLPDSGGFWAGTGKGLVRVQGNQTQVYGAAEGLSNGFVRAIARDRDGSLWVGTEKGLFRFRDGVFARHGEEEGLSSNRILSLLEDREGSLWVGTADGGLDRIQERRIALYAQSEGLSDSRTWSVFEDSRGILWAGTAEGILNRLAPGSDRFEPVADLGATVMAITEDAHGALWIGTSGGGLVRLQGARQRRYTNADGLSGNWISTVHVDRRGRIWAGTMGSGINRLENGKWTNYRRRDGLGADAVFSIFEDRDGDLWVGTFGGGVTRIAKDGGAFRTYTRHDGLPHDVVMSTYQDADGAYWFATRGGLARLADGRFTTYRQKEGVFHDAAQRVLEDGRGFLWFASNRGVFRVAQSELAAAGGEAGRIGEQVTFSTATRMAAAECNNSQHGAWKSRDGKLWFATVKGLVMADPARIATNPVPPQVVIERVVVDGQEVAGTQDLALPPGTRKLEFGYTALTFRNPGAVRFQYRLEGFEKDWVDAGPRRAAYYTNLRPGRYRFRVRAANEDGVWNEAGTARDVALARRLVETTGFRVSAILATALLAAILYRLRVRRLEVRERLRTALVEAQLDALQFQLRPHFLFNTLNSILPLVGKDPDRARQMVVRLGDLLRVSLRSEDTPLISLEEEIAILEKYLSIEQVRFRDRLEVTIAVEPEAADASVPSFLLQPLVENAIKHGLPGRDGRGRIVVTARVEGGELAVTVADNGPGPRTSAIDTSGGIGLRNTRRRLEALYPGRHRLELVGGADGGAELRVRIPLTRVTARPPRPAAAAFSRAS